MADGTINIDLVLNAANSAQSVQEVRRAIRDLQSEAMKVGEGGAGFNMLISKAGELKEKFMDIRLQTKALSEDNFQNLTNAFSRMAQVGTGAFQVVRGYQALFGDESRKTTALLVELEGAMALTRGLQSLGKVADAWRQMTAVVADNLSMLGKSEAVYTAEAAAKQASTVATETAAAAKEAEALATLNLISEEEALAAASTAAAAAKTAEATAIEAATLAQKGFNVAALANPITAAIVAIMAAGAAYAYFAKQAEEARKAQVDLNIAQNNSAALKLTDQQKIAIEKEKGLLIQGKESKYDNNFATTGYTGNEESIKLQTDNINAVQELRKNEEANTVLSGMLTYLKTYGNKPVSKESIQSLALSGSPELAQKRAYAQTFGELGDGTSIKNIPKDAIINDRNIFSYLNIPNPNGGLGKDFNATKSKIDDNNYKLSQISGDENTLLGAQLKNLNLQKQEDIKRALFEGGLENNSLNTVSDNNKIYNTKSIATNIENNSYNNSLSILKRQLDRKEIEQQVYDKKIENLELDHSNKINKINKDDDDREKQSKLESNESIMNLTNLYYKDSMSGINKFYNEKGNLLKQKEEEELRITGLSEAGKQAIRDKYKLLNKQDQESQLTDLLNKVKQLSGNLSTISGTELKQNTKAGIGIDTTDFSSYTMTNAYDAFHTTEEGRTLLRLQRKGIKTPEDYEKINTLIKLRDSSVYNTMEGANNDIIANKNAPLNSELSGNNAAMDRSNIAMINSTKKVDIFGTQLSQWQKFYDERNKLTLRNIEINRQMELNAITLTGQAKINKEKEINAKYDKQNKENEDNTRNAKIAAINKWRDDRLTIEQNMNDSLNNLTSIYDLIRENGKTQSKEKEEQRAKEIFNIHKALTLSMAIPQAYFNVLASWKKFAAANNPIERAMAISDMVAVSIANALNITKIATSKYESSGSGAAATTNTPPVNLYGNGGNLNNLSATNNNTNQQIRTYVLEADITNAQSNVSRYKTSAQLG